MADENLLNERIEDEVDDSDSALNEPIHDSVSDAQVMTVPIDATLTHSNEAADARATGVAIAAAESRMSGEIANVEAEMARYESGIDGQISEFETDITGQIRTLEDDVDGQIAALESGVSAEIDAIPGNLFPVGSIFMTVNASVPTAMPGTWTEILIPTTWNDLKNGTRNWQGAGQTAGGTIHFFLRTA